MSVIRYKASDLFNLLNEEFDARDFLAAEGRIPHKYRLYDPKSPVDSSRDIKKLCERDLINISRGLDYSDVSSNPNDLEEDTDIPSVYCKLYNNYQYITSEKEKEDFIDNLSRVFWFIRPNVYDNRVKFHDLMRILLNSENFVDSISILSNKIKTTFGGGDGDSDKPESQDIKNSLNRIRSLQNLSSEELEKELATTKYKAYVLYEKSFESGPFVRYSKIYNLKYKEVLEEKSFLNLLDVTYDKIYKSKYVKHTDKEHYEQSIENASKKLYKAIKQMYRKEDVVKADLSATDNIYDVTGNIVIPNEGLVEVKMRDHKLDSYLSEFFSIYKYSDLNPKYKEQEMFDIYNAIINSLYNKMSKNEINVSKDLTESFYGIFFGEVEYEGKKMPVFIPSKFMDLYWSNKGKIESGKQLRLTIRYRLKSGSIEGYFYDRDTYKMIPHQFGVSGDEISVSENLNLIKSILTEGRKEDARAKYPDVPESDFNYYVENDPSGNQKYLEWLLKYYFQVNPRGLVEYIKFFHQNQNMFIEKDINRHTPSSLDREIDDVKEKILKREQKKKAKKQSIKIYEDDRWLVISPKSWEASCYYGAGTKWCITMKNNSSYWNKYSKNASFFFIIDKTKLQDDPLYKVAYRKIGRRGKYELWNAPDYEISKSIDGQKYFQELPEELKNRVDTQHSINFPPTEGREEWIELDPRAQALVNGLDTDIIEDIDDYHYGMKIYLVDGDEHYVVGDNEEMDYALSSYYDDYSSEDLMEYYDYEGYYLRMDDEDGFIDDDVRSYLDNTSDREKIEEAGLSDKESDLEAEIEEFESRLESEEDEEEIENLKDLIRQSKRDLNDLPEEAEEILADSYRKEWERCLSDGPKECLIDERGWFSNARELYRSGLVYLDRTELIDNLVSNGDWDIFASYGYDEFRDDEDGRWYVFRIDY
jgi:hypothetical protein